MSASASVAPEPGWSASLALDFAARAGRTVLERRSHRGPLQVQRVFHPEGAETAHVYILHPPGGLVGGDELSLAVSAARSAHALLTTPAATKLYRSSGKVSRSRTTLQVRAGARLEWLPGETLAFSGARAELSTQVELEGDARFVGWEILGLGRPTAGERFSSGRLRQAFEIWRDARPIWIDRGRYEGGGPLLEERWALAGANVSGVLAALPASEHTLQAVRSALVPDASSEVGVTLLGEMLLLRVLSRSTAAARAALERAWQALRPEVIGRPACAPRVWKT
jgi:urease accessory protein